MLKHKLRKQQKRDFNKTTHINEKEKGKGACVCVGGGGGLPHLRKRKQRGGGKEGREAASFLRLGKS